MAGVPRILVGMELEARDDMFLTFQTAMTPEKCEELRRNLGATAYVECSAATGEGLSQLFDLIARAAMESAQ